MLQAAINPLFHDPTQNLDEQNSFCFQSVLDHRYPQFFLTLHNKRVSLEIALMPVSKLSYLSAKRQILLLHVLQLRMLLSF